MAKSSHLAQNKTGKVKAMGRILSVEIKNRNIKILEGSKSGSSITIFKSIFIDIEPGSVDDGKIIDIDYVASTIDLALKKNDIKTKNAIFIINTNATITRNMELPILKSNTETLSMVKSELEQLLPVDLNQYKIVYKKTETINIDGTQKGAFIIYGLPTSIYEQYIDLSERLKLELVAMDISSNCLDKISLQKMAINKEVTKANTSAVFIEVDYSNISFSVLNNGKNVFSRISSNGVNDVVKNFETAFDLSQEAALNEIERISLIENTEIIKDIAKLNILEDNINMWIDEFNRFIRYYNSNNKEKQIEKIYIYGSFAKIAGLDKYLESHLDINTEEINELSNFTLKDINKDEFDLKTYFNNILSLYIDSKENNFLSDSKKKHKSNFNVSVVFMAIALIAVLTAAFFGFQYIVEKSAVKKDLATITEYINKEENIKSNKEAIEIKNKASLMQTYKDDVDKLMIAIKNEDAVNTIIFEQISESLPLGTKVNSLSIEKSSIQMQCTSASRQEVAQFEKNLKQVEFIDSVYIPAVVDGAEGGNISYNYSVICGIKGEK